MHQCTTLPILTCSKVYAAHISLLSCSQSRKWKRDTVHHSPLLDGFWIKVRENLMSFITRSPGVMPSSATHWDHKDVGSEDPERAAIDTFYEASERFTKEDYPHTIVYGVDLLTVIR
ncbi:hypothetical protein HD554DRAFT_2106928 [Boletus coccyginus]|nr:hypothetical protein HD554DRAFT_2106928 [Boletus coccyginus]